MRYVIAPGVHFNEFDGEVVVLDPRADGYLALTGSAAAIWHAVAKGLPAPAIAGRLTARFQVEEPQAAADVTAFLDLLLDRGLIAPA